MAVKYGKFELPQKITLDKQSSTNTFARFIAEPFERGFGHTVGNSMRRMLLSSLEAPAIIGVRIQGIPHEYMAIEGIVEDMTNIILNLKGALLRKRPTDQASHARDHHFLSTELEVTREDLDEHGGRYHVTLGDIVQQGIYEVVNPELPLFTVTKPMKHEIDLRVAVGRGYVPSERFTIRDKAVDEILLDAAFSPVRLVHYFVENTRVGQDTDFDRLIIEVTTDGRVTPVEAISFSAQIGMKHLEVFQQIQSHLLVFEEKSVTSEADQDEIIEKLCLRIDEIELSVRSTNCLAGSNIETIAELVSIPERKMLEFKNFGKKSLNEIKAKLQEMNLHLGMDLSAYDITHENVREKIRQHQEERKRKKDAQYQEERKRKKDGQEEK
jgi:DNA-directed RNA polymerase subunit alpha